MPVVCLLGREEGACGWMDGGLYGLPANQMSRFSALFAGIYSCVGGGILH